MLGFFIGIIITLIIIVILSITFPTAPTPSWVLIHISSIQAIGSLAIACSAIVAFFLYRTTIIRHAKEDQFNASEAFLQEAKQLLEKTYLIFTDKEENTNPPRGDRLLWLTTARMITRYRNIKEKITENAHIEITEEHEEYWRYHFYKLLDQNSTNFDATYLGKINSGTNVERGSIAIVFDFARWNGTDPLEAVDDKRLFASKVLPIDQHGILHYLEQYKKYWGEVLEIRKNEYKDS